MIQRPIEDVNTFHDGLDHPECVAVHRDGSVWAGGEAGQVYRITPDGKDVELISNTGGFILGIAFSPGYDWLALCDLKKKCIWKLDLETRKLSCLATHIEGHAIGIPNYPVFDENGNLYVSDSGEFRKVNGLIYKIKKNGATMIWHPGPFNFPNGMALSPCKKELYVVCTWLPGVESIVINDDGTAGKRSILVTIPASCPDGICIDNNKDIYISCYAPNTILRLDAERRPHTFLHDPEAHTLSNPTNMAISNDGRYMYIANLGRWHIAQIDISSFQNNKK